MSGARLVSATLGTLSLPWWPETVSRTPARQMWGEFERPGRAPLLLTTGKSLGEYQVSYLVRARDLRESVAAHVALLEQMAEASDPVTLMLGDTDRGMFHLAELSIVETVHAVTGEPAAADVSVTLRQSSEATVNVGPVVAVRTTKAKAKKTGKKKTLKGSKGSGRA